MIIINKSKNGQFYVTVKSRNGETLSQSETFKKKANAWKNIAAQSKEYNKGVATPCIVKDNTLKKPVTYYFFSKTGLKITPLSKGVIAVNRKPKS